IIYWYRQKEGKAPERLLLFSGGRTVVDTGFQRNRYMVEKTSGQNQCVLTIKDVIPDDAATYYCAYWDTHSLVYSDDYKIFGTGTKLIVSDKGSSAPVKSEILKKKHENLITYVCLIEKFYPEIIRVTWTDGEKEITDNVGKGDAWKPAKEEEYSIGSWLTVPAENENKNYYCTYEHETQQRSLPTKGHLNFPLDPTKTTQEEDCSTYPGNSTVFNGDHLMHRTAYLVYIILLLKSSMYYLIILFFIYR
ncbi:IGK protein, partial [Caloenas nicobarica]|nr:IGK protein [Caloenas nicobarica]